jgi:xylulokinase
VAPTVFGAPVTVPRPGEYVALGAARQAAWALAGTAAPPPWDTTRPDHAQAGDLRDGERIRVAYGAARAAVHGR